MYTKSIEKKILSILVTECEEPAYAVDILYHLIPTILVENAKTPKDKDKILAFMNLANKMMRDVVVGALNDKLKDCK